MQIGNPPPGRGHSLAKYKKHEIWTEKWVMGRRRKKNEEEGEERGDG